MSFSLLQFVCLLVGASAAIPWTSRWSSEGLDSYKAKTTLGGWEPAEIDEPCRHRIAATMKLALVYAELAETCRALQADLSPLYLTPGLGVEVAAIMSALRPLEVEHLLATQYSHKVPVLVWAIRELRSTWSEGAPVAVRMTTSKLAGNCRILMSERQAIAIAKFLMSAEKHVVAGIKAIAVHGSPYSDVTARLVNSIDRVSSTMAWCRRLVASEMTSSADIMSWMAMNGVPSFLSGEWSKYSKNIPYMDSAAIRTPYFMESASSRAIKTPYMESAIKSAIKTPYMDSASEARDAWNAVNIPERRSINCYNQKAAAYNLVLLSSLLELDTHAVTKALEETVASTTHHARAIPTEDFERIRSTVPVAVSRMLSDVYTNANAMVMIPSVRRVMHSAPEVNTLYRILNSRIAPESHEITAALQRVFDVILTSHKLCDVNSDVMISNITRVLATIPRIFNPTNIEATMKAILMQHGMHITTCNEIVSAFMAHFSHFYRLHKELIASLMEETEAASLTSHPSALLVRAVMATKAHSGRLGAAPSAEVPLLPAALSRVNVTQTTPLMLVPAFLLREVLIHVVDRLAPADPKCFKFASHKFNAGIVRTFLARDVAVEKTFIETYLKKAVAKDINPTECEAVAKECEKMLREKFEKTFVDEDIKTAEKIGMMIKDIPQANFEKPVLEVLTPIVEEVKKMMVAMEKRCSENVEDAWKKSVVAIETSLTAEITEPMIQKRLETIIKDAAKVTPVVKVIAKVLPELTGGMLEKVQIVRAKVEGSHDHERKLVIGDFFVRLISAASPVPLTKHMFAEMPTEKPTAFVTQPRARSIVVDLAAKIENALKAKKIALTKEELEKVMDGAIDKLTKLTYTMPSAEPTKTPIDAAAVDAALTVMADVPLKDLSPRVLRRVVSLALKTLEETTTKAPCMRAVRANFVAGFLRVLIERHLLTSSPESVLFEAIYAATYRQIPELAELQKISQTVSAHLTKVVTDAMAGLKIFEDTKHAEKLSRELLTLPQEQLMKLTVKELLAKPLSAIKAYHSQVSSTCNLNQESFVSEVDTFYKKLAAANLTTEHLVEKLATIIPDVAMRRNVSARIAHITWPEVRHQIALFVIYGKNAVLGHESIHRRLIARTMVEAYGLTGPAPLRGFVQNPLFEVMTWEIRKELVHKLSAMKMKPEEAVHVINECLTHTLKEATKWSEDPAAANRINYAFLF